MPFYQVAVVKCGHHESNYIRMALEHRLGERVLRVAVSDSQWVFVSLGRAI